jgi:hypothetical protein
MDGRVLSWNEAAEEADKGHSLRIKPGRYLDILEAEMAEGESELSYFPDMGSK